MNFCYYLSLLLPAVHRSKPPSPAHAAVSLWQKIAAQNSAFSIEFLSTHPATIPRIQALQSLVPRVMPLYQAAPKYARH